MTLASESSHRVELRCITVDVTVAKYINRSRKVFGVGVEVRIATPERCISGKD